MKKKIALGLSYFAPLAVFAQVTVQDLLGIITDIFNILIPIIITIALVFFIWGVAKFIMSQDDEAGREAARNIMIYGIIALFVIISVWGLVAILNATFGIQAGGGPGGIPTGAPTAP